MEAVLALFAVTFVTTHMLVLFRFGSQVFWTVVEYVWLSLAFLSMISMVGEFRRLTAIEELSSAKAKMETSWQSVVDAVQRCVKYYEGSHPHGLAHPEVSETDVEEAWTRARNWCGELQRAVNLGKEVRHLAGWRGFVGRHESNPFPELEADRIDSEMPDAEYRKRLERRGPSSWFQLRSVYDFGRSNAALAVTSYSSIARNFQELESASERTSTERAGLAVGPWLLAVGLALRESPRSPQVFGGCADSATV